MASNGLLNFQGTNKATFVGTSSNIALDVVNSSLGIGITGTDPPSSNLYITGNAYVTSDISVGGVLNMGVVNVAARHTLEAITALGASTPSTLTLTNTGTSLVASGDVTVDTNTFHVDTTNDRVGIGETSPAELVHIRGSKPQLLIEGESNENANIDFSSGPAYRNRRHQIQTEHYALSGHATSNKMHFRVNAGGENTPSIRMTVRGDGNVGIGLTDPSTLLSLHEPNGGAANADPGFNGTPSTDENYGISWRSTLNSYWNGAGVAFSTATAINAARIYYEAKSYTQVNSSVAGIHGVLNVSVGETEASAKTPCMTWTSNKRTGIGTDSPLAKLQVSGTGSVNMAASDRQYFRYDYNAAFGATATSSGYGWSDASIYASGAILSGDHVVSTNGTLNSSDERIKKNIVDADDAECLEVLRQLKPKKYQYKDEIKNGREAVWGFIAQEVRQSLPYATQIRTECLPNIYELANVSESNVITFTNFNTSTLGSTTVLKVIDKDDLEHFINIAKVVDQHTIRVEEDLSKWIDTVEESEGEKIFVFGQQVDDFIYLKKEAIWTVATAALQEVDRQLQAEKEKVRILEDHLTRFTAQVTARLAALESKK